MDGAEFHGKWPYGGKPPHMPTFSVENYLDEVPLIEHKSGQTWREKIAALRLTTKQLGRPGFMLANNEYGLGAAGASGSFTGNWTRYLKGLVAVELALEMYTAGYDIACFWDTGDGATGSNPSLPPSSAGIGSGHMLLETSAGYRMNPMHLGFELLAKAQNRTMLKLNTTAKRVHGFASLEASSGHVQIFLINKYEAVQKVYVALPASGPAALADGTLTSMVDTADHWGTNTVVKLGAASGCTAGSRVCELSLPALSFSIVQ